MAENSKPDGKDSPSAAGQQAAGPQFGIHRIYLKDASFESPHSPAVFTEVSGKEYQPEIKMDVNMRHEKVGGDLYDVYVRVTVNAKMDERSLFLVEVEQAGTFVCRGMTREQREGALATLGPRILMPYARETIDGLVRKGNFPAFPFAHFDMENLYAQQVAARKEMQNRQGKPGNGAPTTNGAGPV